MLEVTYGKLLDVQRFVSRICADVAARRSVLVLLPAGISVDNVWDAVSDELGRRAFRVRHLSAIGVPGPALLRAVGGDPEKGGAAAIREALLAAPFDVLHVEGFSDLSAEDRGAWLEVLSSWVGAGEQAAISQKTRGACFLMILEAAAV